MRVENSALECWTVLTGVIMRLLNANSASHLDALLKGGDKRGGDYRGGDLDWRDWMWRD